MISRILIPALVLLSLANSQAQTPPPAERKELHPRDSAVKWRLLTKPFGKIYKDRACKDDQVVETPAAFSVVYVIQPSSGSNRVFEVGDGNGYFRGYIKEEDAVLWKQALCLQFEHVGNRNPVLMFNDVGPVKSLVTADEASRKSKAQDYYRIIDTLGEDKVIPPDFPVLSMEPRRMMEGSPGNYLMPIINFEAKPALMSNDEEVRLLQVAIAASKGTPRGATTLQDPEYAKAASQATNAADAGNALVEIVFCFDLTGSMQRYVDICTTMAQQIAQGLGANPQVQERVKFGVWGYQDHDPGREFVVHNFTPQLTALQGLSGVLAQAKASKVSAGDVPEDMLGGVNKVLDEGWAGPINSTIRILVVFGDAPGHDSPGDPKNGSRLGIMQLKEKVDAAKTYVYAIHIRDPGDEFAAFHSQGESQFRTLSGSAGLTATRDAYWGVPGDNTQNFQVAMEGIYTGLNNVINNAQQLLAEGEKRKQEGMVPTEEITPDIIANDLFRAALVDWIGRNSKDAPTPNDITAWISERDLINGEPAVKPTLLITKTQLSELTAKLELILEAGIAGTTTGRDFFASLQSVSAVAAVDPNKLKNATTLKEAGLIPEFISGLPYTTRIMNLSNDLWVSWPPTQQEKFLEDVQNRINLYKDIHNTPSRWIDLDGKSAEDDKVAAIPLAQLP